LSGRKLENFVLRFFWFVLYFDHQKEEVRLEAEL